MRVESHLRGTVPGTGLGLYLTHKLVNDILKGAISFTSRAGQGSTFTIRVPVDVGLAAGSGPQQHNETASP